jgi:hypothetical protein
MFAGGQPDEWMRRVKRARNYFAHQLDETTEAGSEERRREMYVLSLSLRWLLTSVLLIEANVDPVSLNGRLAQHARYQTFLRQARRDLSAVYG